MLDGGTFAVT